MAIVCILKMLLCVQIEASYLSPNVNMASRLQAATKQFKAPLLMSGQFHALLSPNLQAMCRLVDRVTVKGSIEVGSCVYVLPPRALG